MNKKIPVIAAIVTILCFVFVAIGEKSGALQGLNDSFYQCVSTFINPALTALFTVLSVIGEWYIYALVALVLIIIPKTRFHYGIFSFVGVGVACVMDYILKAIVAIPRPDIHRLITESGNGFPSGHAMYGTTFFCILLGIYICETKKMSTKIIYSLLATLFMLVMGISRVYLGVHYLGDIIGGYLAGITISSVFLLLYIAYGDAIVALYRKMVDKRKK